MKDALMIALAALFGCSVAFLLYFQWNEGRDERGQFILRKTYSLAYGILVVGVIALVALVDWSDPILFAGLTIKDGLFLILCLSGIAAGVSLTVCKRRY
ncbi:hypothetical protein [Brevibacillus marinus]|uniref:hypothetical protein n=1 Tax=Brevibacillus marinus TaxID=2496837 RepID=UPI000F834127|nr:hypothetical protein [Brevibacillus marinus]